MRKQYVWTQRRHTIEGCCQILIKFCVEPETFKASPYTSVAQVFPSSWSRSRQCQLKGTISKHTLSHDILRRELRNTPQKLQRSLLQNAG